jgi:hypothetical protein
VASSLIVTSVARASQSVDVGACSSRLRTALLAAAPRRSLAAGWSSTQAQESMLWLLSAGLLEWPAGAATLTSSGRGALMHLRLTEGEVSSLRVIFAAAALHLRSA